MRQVWDVRWLARDVPPGEPVERCREFATEAAAEAFLADLRAAGVRFGSVVGSTVNEDAA